MPAAKFLLLRCAAVVQWRRCATRTFLECVLHVLATSPDSGVYTCQPFCSSPYLPGHTFLQPFLANFCPSVVGSLSVTCHSDSDCDSDIHVTSRGT